MKRKVMFSPGPATTTETVKNAQIVQDISPREKEMECIINDIRHDFVRIVHGGDDYVAIPFCGSGTLVMDVCLNSLVRSNGKILVIENGVYSRRAVGICDCYGIPFIRLQFPYDAPIDLEAVENTLKDNPDVEVVYTTHQETGTGILNPIRMIGSIAHKYNAISCFDTLSTYAMLPIDVEKDNIDFCMGASHKGIMAMTGLSWVVGKKSIIEKLGSYPRRSFYSNLYIQYLNLKDHGKMKFTPPAQCIYAIKQALSEYWEEGEENKWNRHRRVNDVLLKGVKDMGFRCFPDESILSGVVLSIECPNDINWDYNKIHDYCNTRGFELFPTTTSSFVDGKCFRLASFGAIDIGDADDFLKVFRDALEEMGVALPIRYEN